MIRRSGGCAHRLLGLGPARTNQDRGAAVTPICGCPIRRSAASATTAHLDEAIIARFREGRDRPLTGSKASSPERTRQSTRYRREGLRLVSPRLPIWSSSRVGSPFPFDCWEFVTKDSGFGVPSSRTMPMGGSGAVSEEILTPEHRDSACLRHRRGAGMVLVGAARPHPTDFTAEYHRVLLAREWQSPGPMLLANLRRRGAPGDGVLNRLQTR